MLNDIRYALRVLRKNPGFTVVVVLILALGIGANTAIFSVIDAALLRPLPYQDPDRLVMVWSSVLKQGLPQIPVSAADFADIRGQNRVFEQMSGFYLDKPDYNFTGRGEPERIHANAISTNLFSTLGVRPVLGRDFLTDEGQAGREHVAIVSDGFWRRRFGADPQLIGKSVTLDSVPYTVVGIMPQGFGFPPPMTMMSNSLPADCEVWMPLVLDRTNRDYHPLAGVARLKPGVTVEQARAEVATISRRLEQEHPKSNSGLGGTISPMNLQVIQGSRPALVLLLGAVGFVLLIACANVANLLLNRAAGRRREMAIRAALGASRGRTVRQVLTESVLLALGGAAGGILLALWAVDLLRSYDGLRVPRMAEAAVDGRVLLFTGLVAVATGLIFGLAPAWQASRPNLNEFLKQGSRTLAGGGRRQLRGLLVIAEIALALVLLAGAGLLIRSFSRLVDVNPGFDSHHVLAMTVRLPEFKYPDDAKRAAFFDLLLRKVDALPGVVSSGAVNSVPILGWQGMTLVYIEGRPGQTSISDTPQGNYRVASPNYLRTLRIPVLEGRFFDERDNKGGAGVAVISAGMARRYYPGEDAVGKRIKVNDVQAPWRTIVGIAGDIHDAALDREPEPEFYLPAAQDPWEVMTVLVRTAGDPARLAAAVRSQVWSLDREQPVYDIKTMDEIVAGSVASRRFSMLLVSLFSAFALLLASLGIYGVVSYSVSQRTREIGIRMAMGAQRSEVLRMMLGQGLRLALIGVVCGLAGAYVVTRAMAGLLYEVRPADPLTLAAVSLLLLGVALVATLVPARRAIEVDPTVALRYE
jgi:predicted permease